MSTGEKLRPSEVGLYGYKSTARYELLVCPYCKEPYRRYPGEVEYIYQGLKFCTFPCKNRYRKQHPEKTKVEKVEISYKKKLQKKREKYKETPKKQQETKTSIIQEILKINPAADLNRLYPKTKEELKRILKELKDAEIYS